MDKEIQDGLHLEKIKLGQMAERFLDSSEWKELLKPLIDNMLLGVSDIRSIKQSDISSAKKTEAIIIGRQMTADYLSEIELSLQNLVADGKFSQTILEKKSRNKGLYKHE